MDNRCICCGEIIPEGRQVCPSCERKGGRRVSERIRIRRAFSRITRVFHKGRRYTVCTDGMKFGGDISGVYGAALHELRIIDEEHDEYLRREER